MRKLTRWELEDLGTALTTYGATVRRNPTGLKRLMGLFDLFGLHRPGTN